MEKIIKPKIIFLTEVHFNKRDYDRFGMETLMNNGFEVEVWNFTPFLTNEAYQKVVIADFIQWSGHLIYKTQKDAISAILALKEPCIIFSLLSYNFRSLAVYRAISKRKLFYCEHVNAYPISAMWAKQSLKRKLAGFTMGKLCSRLLFKMPSKVLGVRPVYLRLINAEKFMRSSIPVDEKSTTLWTHNFDYDLFLETKGIEAFIKKDVGVFLDQYFPFHSDFTFMGKKSLFNAEEYYGALCRVFDYLESKFGLKIVIAAHPRSHYDEKPDLFGGREVIRGKTIELVRNAEFIIAHNSAAINLAVLFKRPILFLTSNQIIENYNNGLDEPPVGWLASLFGKEAHNMDHTIQIDFHKELEINEELYRNFKNCYIKKEGSEELPFWQIFVNYLKKEYVPKN